MFKSYGYLSFGVKNSGVSFIYEGILLMDMFKHLAVRRLDTPHEKDIENDINWLIDTLSLKSGRDLQKTSNRIFREVLNSISHEGNARCEDVARRLELRHGCVNHHVRQFIESGIIRRERARLYLRGGSLKRSLEELRKDIYRIFDEMLEIADEVDVELGFSNRR